MKGLYFTDPQLSAKTPSGRTDNFPVAAYKKFYEIGLIIKRENVEAVFIGGDLFNTPRISLKYAGEIAKLIKTWDVPVYVVPGNHDIYGYNIDTIDQTILGMFEKTGVVELLTRDNPVTFDIKGVVDDYTVCFEGQEYYEKIDTVNVQQDYDVKNISADFKVLIPHGMLLEKPFHPDVPYALLKDVAQFSNADVIFGAHYHPGWPTQTINGVTFINPGSLLRMERSLHNQTAMPKVVVFAIEENNGALGFNHKEIQLTVAQKGDQVFDFTSKQQKQQTQTLLTSFKSSLQGATLLTNVTSIPDMIKAVATACSVDNVVLNQALNFVTSVNISGDEDVPDIAGYVEKTHRIWIKRVVITNYQSHKDTVIEFKEGLNVIVGESNQGKTAILRAIEWCLYNSPGGADFIRTGENLCSVVVEFSDGSIIKRERTKSSAGTYETDTPHPIDPLKVEHRLFKGFTNAIPVDIANIHQMPKVYLAKDLQVNLNVSSQLDGAFLLQESGANKAAAIGRLVGVESIDSAIKEVSKQVKAAQRDIKTYEQMRDNNMEELKKFTDLDDMNKLIQVMEFLIAAAKTTEVSIEELQVLDEEYVKCQAEILAVQQELEELPDIDIHIPLIDKAIVLMHELRFLREVLQKYITAVDARYKGETVLGWIPKSDEYDGLILEAEILMKDINNANDLRKQRVAIYKELQEEQDKLNNFVDVDQLDAVHELLHKKNQDLHELWKLWAQLHNLRIVIEQEEDSVKHFDDRVKHYEDEVKQVELEMERYLTEVGVCPTCGTQLSSDHMNHIIGRDK